MPLAHLDSAQIRSLITGTTLQCLSAQFAGLLLLTILDAYFILLTARKWSWVRSHLWILLDSVFASGLAFLWYRGVLVFGLSKLWAIALLWLWSGVMWNAVRIFDRGRSVIDLDPRRKVLFRVDFRVMSHAAVSAALLMFMAVKVV